MVWPKEPGCHSAELEGMLVECFAFVHHGRLRVVTASGEIREQEDRPNLKQFERVNLRTVKRQKSS